jgi:hypothetical protein
MTTARSRSCSEPLTISLAEAEEPSIMTASGISVSSGCMRVRLFIFFEAT